jgi:two-component system response regulator FixJ
MTNRPVYVVDDEEPIRRSACLLLKVNRFAPAAFEDGTSFLEAESTLEPGCILLDIRMPDVDGIGVQCELQRRSSPHATIMMTGHGEISSAVAALGAGAIGFIEKPFSKTQLLPALDLAFQKILEPALYEGSLMAARAKLAGLADREREMLSMLAEDRPIEEIAADLELTRPELDASRATILEQLGVDNVPAALAIAFASRERR